jgi:2-phospho-L-lactate guanylyltransferase
MLRYDVVIPVKPLVGAKSRLAASVDEATRSALARAFALDTIEAACSAQRVARVIVVGDLSGHLDEVPEGLLVVAEPEPRSLAAAIRHGIAEARRTAAPAAAAADEGAPTAHDADPAGRSHRGIAVLLGDLPALTSAALDAALGAAARHPLAFMPDADATGSTLATAAAHTRFEPAFGVDSASLHRTLGFHDLSHELAPAIAAPARRDVDTIDALEAALQLGIGTHTAEAVAALAEGALEHDPRAAEDDAARDRAAGDHANDDHADDDHADDPSHRPDDSTRKGAA